MVIAIETPKLGKNPKPFFKKIGSEINNAKEGITNQKILIDNSEIPTILLLSIYIHTIAKTDIKGKDAKIPPANELLLDISDIKTNIIADNKIFNT